MCTHPDSSVSHVAKAVRRVFYASDLEFWVTGHCVSLLAQLDITSSRLWIRAPTFMTAEPLAFTMALDTFWV